MKLHLSSILLASVCALAVGLAIAFAILLPLAGKVADQARAGKQARVLQCQLAPTAMKGYEDWLHRGIWTQVEFNRIRSVYVQACPPRKG